MTDDSNSPKNEPNQSTESHWIRVSIMAAALVLAIVTLGWWGLAIIAGLVLMIFLHELGHFIMAKRAGMKVTEFFLCFGPKLWSFRRGETEYGIKLIPLGAYVKIVGMSMAEEVDEADLERTYRAKPFWERFGVAVAGSTMHFLQALVLIFVILVFTGVPGGTMTMQDTSHQPAVVGDVYAHCPAAQAGMRPDDEVLAVNGERVRHYTELGDMIAPLANQDATFTIKRGEETKKVVAHIVARDDSPGARGLLGVTYGVRSADVERVGALRAIPQTFQEFGNLMGQTLPAFFKAFSPSSLKSFGNQVANAKEDRRAAQTSVAGSPSTTVLASSQSPSAQQVSTAKCVASMGGEPAFKSTSVDETEASSRFMSIIGIFEVGRGMAENSGLSSLLALFVLVNIFIGLFNLIPLPPFDGGHVMVAVWEKIQEWRKGMSTRYYVDANKLLPVTSIVILLLGLLAVTTIYLDVVNPPRLN